MKKMALLIPILLMSFTVAATGCGCEHEWQEASCTEPKTCTLCEETEGEALGHEWEEALCETPKTCARCGLTEGTALGHNVAEWSVDAASTCSKKGQRSGVCSNCGQTLTEETDLAEHTPGDWEVKTKADLETAGIRVKKCTVCGAELETESYELSDKEKREAFQKECKSYSYDKIARDPDQYLGKKAVFKGEVIQVMESGNTVALRVNITKGKYGIWDDTIYVQYTKASSDESRILEDDIVTMYGYLSGMKTYETVMGSTLTIPAFEALYISVNA